MSITFEKVLILKNIPDKKVDVHNPEYLIRIEIRNDYTARLTVWDNELKDFVFWKDCLTYNCKIDMLRAYERDLETMQRTQDYNLKMAKITADAQAKYAAAIETKAAEVEKSVSDKIVSLLFGDL